MFKDVFFDQIIFECNHSSQAVDVMFERVIRRCWFECVKIVERDFVKCRVSASKKYGFYNLESFFLQIVLYRNFLLSMKNLSNIRESVEFFYYVFIDMYTDQKSVRKM